jgi:multisubunit Na+/H+ antiporter MnhC subunit
MDTKKIFGWLLLLFGETLIVTAFILFRGNLAANILVLNIVVSSLVYFMFFAGYRVPWLNLQDKSKKQIGSLGISWKITWLYFFFAIAVMIVCNITLDLSFSTQLIMHGVLLFFLLLGVWLSSHASDKVQAVYEQETFSRNRIVEIKMAVTNLKDKMNDLSNLPESFINRINSLEENLRFISPSANQEAYNLEQQFITTINDIAFAVSNFSMNEEKIESNLKKVERIYQNRKQIYSN